MEQFLIGILVGYVIGALTVLMLWPQTDKINKDLQRKINKTKQK